MKNENGLKIYLLSQTTLMAAWTSLMGDKYAGALPFTVQFTEDIAEADVIAWDGFLNKKGEYYLSDVLEQLKTGRPLLLLQREAFTLFKDHPFLDFIDTDQVNTVELAGGNVLPEDLMAALETCYRKITHV